MKVLTISELKTEVLAQRWTDTINSGSNAPFTRYDHEESVLRHLAYVTEYVKRMIDNHLLVPERCLTGLNYFMN